MAEIDKINREREMLYIILYPILKIRCGNPAQYQGQSIPKLSFRIINRGELNWIAIK